MSVSFNTINGALTATFTGTGALSGATAQLTDSNGDTATVAIIEGYSSIGSYAFLNATSLTSVTIGTSVTTFGQLVFYASNLTSINIPSGVTSIEDNAFAGLFVLTSITVTPSNTNYKAIDGVLFDFNEENLIHYPLGDTRTSYEIPAGVININQSSFSGASSLTSITIPTSVTTIGSFAFSQTSIPSITIPAKVSTIAYKAFNATSNLTWVAFEENSELTSSGLGAAFIINSGLTTIYAYQPLIDTMGWTRSDSTDPPTLNHIGGKHDINVSTDQPPAQAPPSPICFPAGTPVTTDQGLIAIEKLNTDEHTIRGKEIVAITQTRPLQKHIVCFGKDSLSKNVPSQETYCSMEHKIFYKREMMKARDIVKLCENVSFIPYNGEILYNVLLKKQDKMMINNLICETLDPKNIMAKISTIKDGQKKSKAIQELTKILKNNNIPGYHKLYASL